MDQQTVGRMRRIRKAAARKMEKGEKTTAGVTADGKVEQADTVESAGNAEREEGATQVA